MQTRIKPNTTTTYSIHPETQIASVSLNVANLGHQIDFYQGALGFLPRKQENNRVIMGSEDKDLLELVEDPTANRVQGVTGLYHFAVLLPNRRELAKAIARLYALGITNYPTDHVLTKTTYLNDLEGNGIELYCESPEDGSWSFKNGEYITRRSDGSLSSGRDPLDVEALFKHLQEDDQLDGLAAKETRIGHVHLHVRDLDEAVDFYHGLLGFDIMGIVDSIGMAFVSACGYHHHIGLNTWKGQNAPSPPTDSLGLRYFSVNLPNQAAFQEVKNRVMQTGYPGEIKKDSLLLSDPSQNGVLLTFRE